MKKGKLIVIAAPSGSGKTTVVKNLISDESLNLGFSVSATSREKRENEINGKDYYFLSKDEFEEKINLNEFIEWEEVYDNTFYGTLKSEFEASNKLIPKTLAIIGEGYKNINKKYYSNQKLLD